MNSFQQVRSKTKHGCQSKNNGTRYDSPNLLWLPIYGFIRSINNTFNIFIPSVNIRFVYV